MKSWWLRLLRYALPQWKGVSASLLLTVLGVLVDVLKPWPLKLIVDSVLGRQPLPPIAGWLYGLPGGESAEIASGMACRRNPGSVSRWLGTRTGAVLCLCRRRQPDGV